MLPLRLRGSISSIDSAQYNHLGVLPHGTSVTLAASAQSVVDEFLVVGILYPDPKEGWNTEYPDVVIVGLVLKSASV